MSTLRRKSRGLTSETFGLSPNAPLTPGEEAHAARYSWRPPRSSDEKWHRHRESVFYTKYGEEVTFGQFLRPTEPMDIDSSPPHSPGTPTRGTSHQPGADPMDIDSGPPDATGTPHHGTSAQQRRLGTTKASCAPGLAFASPQAKRGVHFYPTEADRRPVSEDSVPLPIKKGKSILVERIHAYDQLTVTDQYVPFEPYPFDYDVDYSDHLGLFQADVLRTSLARQRTLPDWKPREPLRSPEAHRSVSHNHLPLKRSPRAPQPHELYPALQNSVLGKRARGEQTATHAASSPVRTIRGRMIDLVKVHIPTFFSSIWSRIWRGQDSRPQPQEMVAVETSPNGGKRRAIAAQDVELKTSPRIGRTAMPGGYPALSPPTAGPATLGGYPVLSPPTAGQAPVQSAAVLATPPNSRPTTSDQNSSEAKQAMMNTKPTDDTAEESIAQRQARTSPTTSNTHTQRRVPRTRPKGMLPEPGHSALDYFTSNVGQIQRPAPAKPYRPQKPSKMDEELRQIRRDCARALREQREARVAAQKSRDSEIDALILKAKKATIESPEQRALRKSISTRKRRDEEKKAAKIAKERAKEAARLEEERNIATEKAKEAARLQEERKIAKEKAKEAARLEEERKIVEEEKKKRKQAEEEARVTGELERLRIAEEAAGRAAKAASRPLIPILSAELEQKVAEIMAGTDGSKIVAKTTGGTELKRYDLGRILPQPHEKQLKNLPRNSAGGPGAWLNDEAINGFISAIVTQKLDQAGYVKRADVVPSHVAYDTNWYPQYQKGGMPSISRWSRRKHISGERLLQCDKIFFPCSTGSHWTLLIISPQARKIEFLDSAGGRRSHWFRIAREWLAMELGAAYLPHEWEDGAARSQLQSNMDDCGAYTCMNALASAKDIAFEQVTMNSARKFIVAVLVSGGFGANWEL